MCRRDRTRLELELRREQPDQHGQRVPVPRLRQGGWHRRGGPQLYRHPVRRRLIRCRGRGHRRRGRTARRRLARVVQEPQGPAQVEWAREPLPEVRLHAADGTCRVQQGGHRGHAVGRRAADVQGHGRKPSDLARQAGQNPARPDLHEQVDPTGQAGDGVREPHRNDDLLGQQRRQVGVRGQRPRGHRRDHGAAQRTEREAGEVPLQFRHARRHRRGMEGMRDRQPDGADPAFGRAGEDRTQRRVRPGEDGLARSVDRGHHCGGTGQQRRRPVRVRVDAHHAGTRRSEPAHRCAAYRCQPLGRRRVERSRPVQGGDLAEAVPERGLRRHTEPLQPAQTRQRGPYDRGLGDRRVHRPRRACQPRRPRPGGRERLPHQPADRPGVVVHRRGLPGEQQPDAPRRARSEVHAGRHLGGRPSGRTAIRSGRVRPGAQFP